MAGIDWIGTLLDLGVRVVDWATDKTRRVLGKPPTRDSYDEDTKRALEACKREREAQRDGTR